jgi:hypothetical protein
MQYESRPLAGFGPADVQRGLDISFYIVLYGLIISLQAHGHVGSDKKENMDCCYSERLKHCMLLYLSMSIGSSKVPSRPESWWYAPFTVVVLLSIHGILISQVRVQVGVLGKPQSICSTVPLKPRNVTCFVL